MFADMKPLVSCGVTNDTTAEYQKKNPSRCDYKVFFVKWLYRKARFQPHLWDSHWASASKILPCANKMVTFLLKQLKHIKTCRKLIIKKKKKNIEHGASIHWTTVNCWPLPGAFAAHLPDPALNLGVTQEPQKRREVFSNVYQFNVFENILFI